MKLTEKQLALLGEIINLDNSNNPVQYEQKDWIVVSEIIKQLNKYTSFLQNDKGEDIVAPNGEKILVFKKGEYEIELSANDKVFIQSRLKLRKISADKVETALTLSELVK